MPFIPPEVVLAQALAHGLTNDGAHAATNVYTTTVDTLNAHMRSIRALPADQQQLALFATAEMFSDELDAETRGQFIGRLLAQELDSFAKRVEGEGSPS